MTKYSIIQRLSLAALLTLPVTFLESGCNSEETIVNYDIDTVNVTLSETIWPPIVVDGWIQLTPGLTFWMGIYGSGETWPSVDSVLVADSAAVIREQPDEEPDFPYSWASYYNLADSTRFSSGDIVAVEYYAPHGMSAANIRLLDAEIDKPTFVDTSTQNVDIGAPFTLVWNRVANADWYAFWIYLAWDSTGIGVSDMHVLDTRDTTLVVPGWIAKGNGAGSITPVAVTGPYHTDSLGNFSGDVVQGILHSYAYGSHKLLKVGTGSSAAVALPSPHPERDLKERFLTKLFSR